MLKILYAEDDVLIATTIREELEDAGYQVDHFPDGANAAVAFGCMTYDLLLTDLAMPRMDGAGLIAHIRLTHPEFPVVMVTGFPPGDFVEDARSAVLLKPFRMKTLVNLVGEIAKLPKRPTLVALSPLKAGM